MALKSTIFKAELQLADIDHGCYTDLSLTLARHPSETDERMLVRLAALALNAHQVQALCGGDGQIGFGKGLVGQCPPFAMRGSEQGVGDFNSYGGAPRCRIKVGVNEGDHAREVLPRRGRGPDRGLLTKVNP